MKTDAPLSCLSNDSTFSSLYVSYIYPQISSILRYRERALAMVIRERDRLLLREKGERKGNVLLLMHSFRSSSRSFSYSSHSFRSSCSFRFFLCFFISYSSRSFLYSFRPMRSFRSSLHSFRSSLRSFRSSACSFGF